MAWFIPAVKSKPKDQENIPEKETGEDSGVKSEDTGNADDDDFMNSLLS